MKKFAFILAIGLSITTAYGGDFFYSVSPRSYSVIPKKTYRNTENMQVGSDSLNVYDQPYRTPSFEAKEGERLDIRILLRASLEFDDRGAGIMGGIYLEDVN